MVGFSLEAAMAGSSWASIGAASIEGVLGLTATKKPDGGENRPGLDSAQAWSFQR